MELGREIELGKMNNELDFGINPNQILDQTGIFFKGFFNIAKQSKNQQVPFLFCPRPLSLVNKDIEGLHARRS